MAMDDHEDTNPARRLPLDGKPTQKLQPSPAIKKLISMLGLRYPPSSKQDEEGRAGLLALMAIDVAIIPVDILEMAIDRWVAAKAFMPKTSELLAFAREEERRERERRAEYIPGDPYAARNSFLQSLAGRDETRKRWLNGSLQEPFESGKRALPLSCQEIDRMQHGGALQRAAFDMGVSNGWLIPMGDGRYRERDHFDGDRM